MDVACKIKNFNHIQKDNHRVLMSRAYLGLNEFKRKSFDAWEIEDVDVELSYKNYQFSELIDLILPQGVPR